MLVTGLDFKEILSINDLLKTEFDMKDLRHAKLIIGMNVVKNKDKHEMKLSHTI